MPNLLELMAFLRSERRLIYDLLPKFRPIIYTTGTTHYPVGKFISELLQPLTHNEYILKNTFDTANRIKAIPPALFAKGYEFVPFDVESVFTNGPLQRTLKIIVDRIYNKIEACQNEAQEIYAPQTNLRYLYENRLFLQQAVRTNRWCKHRWLAWSSASKHYHDRI